MARGIRASLRQRVAGRKNLFRANSLRTGRRGTHYKPKMPKPGY